MKCVNLLIKPASSLCNLRCKYCFYEDEAQNRGQYCMGIMQEDLTDTLIRRAFDAVDPDGMVSFAFQGGEPTLAGLPYFLHFTEMVRQYCPQKIRVSFAIQTNGTLLNEDWVRFFKREGFLVGLSVDGFRKAHEAYRVDSEEKGTWKRVLAAKAVLDQHQVDYNALCVVTGACAEYPEKAYGSLKNLGFRYMQFIACLDPIGHKRGKEPWSLSPAAYGAFLCRLFDLWYQDWADGNYHSIRLFEDFVHILLGDGASACATCGKCGEYLVIEGDGTVYPCDFFALDNWKIGRITEMTVSEMATSRQAVAFRDWGHIKPEECQTCPYGTICNGGCKNDWYTDETGTHNYFCAAFRSFLDYTLPRLHHIAQAELAARQRYCAVDMV